MDNPWKLHTQNLFKDMACCSTALHCNAAAQGVISQYWLR